MSYSSRAVRVSTPTCSAVDLVRACTAVQMQPDCRPNPDALQSACRLVAAPFDQATLVLSRDHGLNKAPASSRILVDPEAVAQGDQTVALGIAIHPETLVIGVLYERVSNDYYSTIKVAFFNVDGGGAFHPLGASLFLHRAPLSQQAYVNAGPMLAGTFDGADDPNGNSLVALPGSRFLAVYSRIHAAPTPTPALIAAPPVGQQVIDTVERSRFMAVLLG